MSELRKIPANAQEKLSLKDCMVHRFDGKKKSKIAEGNMSVI
jgi:hypothetical protein